MAKSVSKQYNFKLNEAVMEQARVIIKAKGMTMTDAFTMFIDQIVLEQDLPIKTSEEVYRERLINELQKQSEEALKQYKKGQRVSLEETRERYDV